MGDFQEFVLDPIKDFGRDFDDAIIQPVKNGVEAIIENPRALVGVALAVAFPGAGAALGSSLGLTGAAAQVVGQALINTAVNGGDVKAAVISAAVPVIGQQASNLIGETLTQSGITGNVNTVITNAATRGLTAAALGKDPLAAMVLSGTTAAVNLIAEEIPGFSTLHPSVQSTLKNAVATKLTGGDVGQSLVNSAIEFARDEVYHYQRRESVLNDLSKEGINLGSDYSSLSPEQKAIVDRISSAPDYKEPSRTTGFFDKLLNRPTPEPGTTRQDLIASYKDTLYTDESEATEMARAILGREPTEFEVMEFIGIPESNTKSLLENIKYDESTFDSGELAAAYKAVYGKEPTAEWLASDEAFDMLGRSDAQGKNMLQNYYTEDKNVTTLDEAEQIWERMGNTRPMTTDELAALSGRPERSAEALAQHAQVLDMTIYNGRDYATPQEAAEGAQKAGMTEFFGPDGQIYKVLTPVQEGAAKDAISKAATFNEAFAEARQKLGAGKTFEYNGKLYTTDYAAANKAVPFDGSKLETKEDAAKLAVANGKLTFTHGGKTYGLDMQTASTIANSQNQSDAETNRLLRQAIKPATDESMAETQRLVSSGTRGTMDTVSTVLANTFGTTTEGLGKLVQSFGDAYSLATGEPVGNSIYKAGQALEAYGKEKQVYGADVQTERMAQVNKLAAEADNEYDRIKILAEGAAKYPIGFWGEVGKEVGQEAPTVLTGLAAGAALVLGAPAVAVAGGAKLASSFFETVEVFGAEGGEVERALLKKGVPADKAREAALMQGTFAAAITFPTEYIANKALVDSWFGGLKDATVGTVIAKGGSAVGAQVAAEMMQTLPSTLSAQYLVNGAIDMNAAMAATYYAGMISGTTTGTMVAPNSIRDAVVVAKDYNGGDVTWGEFTSGSKIPDLKTLDLSAQIAESKDGNAVTLGTLTAAPVGSMPSYEFLKDVLPASVINQNYIVGEDALGNPVTLDMLTNEVKSEAGYDTVFKNLLDATPKQKEEAQYDFLETVLKDSGYKPTEQEIRNLITDNPTGSADLQAKAEQYVEPKMVTEQEAKDAYAKLGLNRPTQDDIAKLVGQYDETGLAGKATANLDAARYNSLLQQIEQLGSQPGIDKAALDVIKNDINAQIADLGGDVTKLQAGLDSIVSKQAAAETQLSDLQKSLSDEIQAAKDIGLEGDAAIQAGLDSLAGKVGTNQVDLLAQLGTTAADLKAQFAEDIATAQKATSQEIADTKTALETAIADAKDAGLKGDEALKSAIDTVAADQKTSAADLLEKLGTTEADLKTEFATGLADVTTAVADTRKALEDAIQAAKDIGLEGDVALQAGIDSVAAELGTTKEALLTQLGTTEETLRTEFATGIAGLETQMKEQYDALTTEQKALADALTAQGTTLADAIAAAQESTATQISDLEAQTKEQYDTLTAAQKATADALLAQGTTLADAIEAAKSETATQIADVETRLTDAIAAAEAAGLTRDEAITSAVASVATDLGTTKEALLAQMGKTEEALRTEFSTGLADVSAEVKAAYDALTTEQKALADQLTQQGTDLATAIQTAQQETAGQIKTLSADVQAKYDALTAEQKALAEAMAQQGLDLTAAIDLAAQQTQAQITGLGQQVDTRINELMQQGQTYQQATQQAIGELNTQNKQLQELVGTQGRAATQADVDALTQMLGGQRSVDLAYDVTGDKQITQADIDFLTQVVGGVKTDWTAPVGSAFGPTGLYGQLATNEAQRQADLQAQLQRERDAAAAAAEAQRQGAVKTALGQGQQTLQQIQQQLPQALQQAQQVSTPIYGEMGPYLDIGSELDFGFFKPSPEKLAATKQQQPTKIAAGGYIDGLLAEDMSVDDLLNLLR